jgi:hypothetical protein
LGEVYLSQTCPQSNNTILDPILYCIAKRGAELILIVTITMLQDR